MFRFSGKLNKETENERLQHKVVLDGILHCRGFSILCWVLKHYERSEGYSVIKEMILCHKL